MKTRSLNILLLLAAFTTLGLQPVCAAERSYVSGNYMLNLDNINCGFVKSVDGGGISAEVINEPSGSTYFVKKHPGQPKYEEFTAQIGFSMTKSVFDWISESWKMNYQRKSGKVITCDFNLNAKSIREFSQAILTETTIPACDGSSKEPAYITIKFAPEQIKYSAEDGKKVADESSKIQKHWLPSNFRLQIDGLNCNRVNKIDSFTVKQAAVSDNVGDARDYQTEPGKILFPNLTITMAESDAQSWVDWHKDFVINGNNDESKEKNGTLTFFTPGATQRDLARIKFFNLGIFRLEPDKAEANADQIKRVTASLYCERMEFEYLGNEVGAESGNSSSPANETAASGDAQKPNEDCQLGVNYSLGAQNPINLTVKSIEYTAERRKVGNEYRRPDADHKMVVVHYTLQNPSNQTTHVSTSSIDWTLTDSANVNYPRERYAGIEETGEVVNSTFSPGQSVNCFACFPMPGKGKAARLIAAAHGETANQAIYRLEDKMTPLPQLYAEPSDPSGSTRRLIVPGKMGETYQIQDYDIKVDSINYTTQPILDYPLTKDQQFMLMTVEYTNFTGAGYSVAGNNIEVIDQNGQSYKRLALLAPSAYVLVTPKPQLEATAKFRLLFRVPKDFKLDCINLRNSFRTMVAINNKGVRPIDTPSRRRTN